MYADTIGANTCLNMAFILCCLKMFQHWVSPWIWEHSHFQHCLSYLILVILKTGSRVSRRRRSWKTYDPVLLSPWSTPGRQAPGRFTPLLMTSSLSCSYPSFSLLPSSSTPDTSTAGQCNATLYSCSSSLVKLDPSTKETSCSVDKKGTHRIERIHLQSRISNC